MDIEYGRFNLHDKPLAFPFTDIVNRTPEGPVFDLGVVVELYSGVVYIKAEHIQVMAERLGMITADKAAELIAENAKLQEAATKLPDKIGRFTDGIDTLVRDYHAGLLLSGDISDSSDDERSASEIGGDIKTVDNDDLGITFSAFGQELGLDIIKGPDDISAGTSNAPAGKSGT